MCLKTVKMLLLFGTGEGVMLKSPEGRFEREENCCASVSVPDTAEAQVSHKDTHIAQVASV